MDRFTRNYSIVLGLLLVAVLAWVLYEDPRVSELNDRLEEAPEVAGYPYRFRVLSLVDGVATMSTPRSSAFPVQQALGILFPHLANRAQDAPDLMAAQQQLATVQKRAQEIVLASGEVKRVRWKLDRDWLVQHGAQLGTSLQ
ncbi:MAG: hypothetical protein OQL28_06685 [Sedimenticola sp.]|nr:hypothetical protein [Sedimenticola sp.]